MVRSGEVDLSGWRFVEQGPVALNGEWGFYWRRFLAPGEGGVREGRPPAFVRVPGHWTGQYGAASVAEVRGYATYTLRVRLSGSAPERLALRLPEVYSAYRLWVNGTEQAHIGTVGRDPEATKPGRGGRQFTFPVTGSELRLTLQVSNFTSRDAGILLPVELGTPEQIEHSWLRSVIGQALLVGGLAIMGFSQLAVFVIRRGDRAYLYFGLWTLLWAARSSWDGAGMLVVLSSALPVVTIQALDGLTLVLVFFFFFKYLEAVFPNEFPRYPGVVTGGLAVVHTVAILTLPPIMRSQLFAGLLVVGAVLLATCVPPLMRAYRAGRDGALPALFGFLLLLLLGGWALGFRLITGEKAYTADLAMLLFAGTHAFLLAQRYTQAFERAQRLENSLRRANRLKDDFLANISHELRTPLHGMIGIAESLGARGGRSADGQSLQQGLDIIVASGKRLARLVGDILDFTRLRHSDLVCRFEPVHVGSVVSLVLDTCRPLVGDRPVTLSAEIPPNLPPVRADANRLQQILFNLVGNAVKFTDRGSVTVVAERHEDAVQIAVRDTGMGLSDEDFKRIFEPYEQGDHGPGERGGAGLGLTITRRLVELHGGHLSVTSREGEGTTFWFALPVAAMVGATTVPVMESTKVGGEESSVDPGSMGSPEASAKGRRILVVDDDPMGRQVLERQLTLAGYATDSATSGEEALESIVQAPPDLVILDVMMPEMNGYEVCRRIREEFDATALPVLMLTARTREGDAAQGLRAGANDYLAKPFVQEELLARVEAQMRVHDNEQLRWALAREMETGSAGEEGGELDLRGLLVEVLRTAVHCWEQTTGRPKADLAEESGVWTVTLDGSVRKTRTLDRYMDVETLPKRPRWRNVLATAAFVLEHCPESELGHALSERVGRFERQFQEAGQRL